MKYSILIFTLLLGFTTFSQGLTLGKEITPELKLEKGKRNGEGKKDGYRSGRKRNGERDK